MYRPINLMCCLLFSLVACEEAIDWELMPGTNGHLAVEAIITDQFIQQSIRLSQSYDGLNGAVPAVTDALVTVAVNGVVFAFVPDLSEPGLYKSEVPFSAIKDLEYTLDIRWKDQKYTATSQLSSVAPMPNIRFRQIGVPDSLTFGDFVPLYNANQQAMYEMNIDWSHLSNGPKTSAKMIFYTFNTLDVSELVRPPQDTVVFPRGSIIIAKKYGLNDDFAAYLRALAIETTWKGGAFYGTSANLPTNISEDGLGFFSTCAILVDTLVAE
ncbi:MAG: DUF4249 family protein [Saprospiraceae bacterium]